MSHEILLTAKSALKRALMEGYNLPTREMNHAVAAIDFELSRMSHMSRPQSNSLRPVGVTYALPGSEGGFTMVVFSSNDVPVGATVYIK